MCGILRMCWDTLNVCVYIYIYICMYMLSCSLQSCPTIAHQAPLSMGISRQNTRVCRHALFQGIFLIQGLNSSLLYPLHLQVGSLPLVPPGNLYIKTNNNKPIIQIATLSRVKEVTIIPGYWRKLGLLNMKQKHCLYILKCITVSLSIRLLMGI